jgi:hypothetical protein
MFVIALLIILASVIIRGIIHLVWGKPRALYVNSMPTDNYVEASFDNWLDWFMIAPDKWDFKKHDYDNYWRILNEKERIEIPCRIEERMNRKCVSTFIKFSYDDFKKYRKWYKQYLEDQVHQEEIKEQERIREQVNQNTAELLKAVQQDIDAYKAKIDGEMDNAMSTCRDVTERINNEIAQKGNVKAVDWDRYFAEWLAAYKRGETY